MGVHGSGLQGKRVQGSGLEGCMSTGCKAMSRGLHGANAKFSDLLHFTTEVQMVT